MAGMQQNRDQPVVLQEEHSDSLVTGTHVASVVVYVQLRVTEAERRNGILGRQPASGGLLQH